MSRESRKLSLNLLWVAPRFADDGKVAKRSSQAIYEFIEQVNSMVRSSIPGSVAALKLAFRDYQVRGPKEMQTRVGSSHVAIFDISCADPDVMYAIGLCATASVPYVLIQSADSLGRGNAPLSVADERVVLFDSYGAFAKELMQAVMDITRDLVKTPRVTESALTSLWFPEAPSDVHIIAPLEDEKSEFAAIEAKDYIYLDNLGDRDSILAVYGFLRRHYPRSNVVLHSSEDFPTKFLERDLVVIGGPGVPENGIAGNAICRLMLAEAGCSLQYAPDGSRAYFSKREWKPVFEPEKGTRRDFGYYARFSNPFNQSHTVVLINGLHTPGVLGAFLAFSDHPRAYHNFESVSAVFGSQADFECGFYVQMHRGTVLCPDEVTVEPV